MDLARNKPIYESIADNYRKLMQKGVYPPGAMLPSVREVALSERINPNTVVRAYALLVEEGAITSIPKKGYFVAKTGTGPSKSILRDSLRDLLAMGYTEDDILSELQTLKGEHHD